MVNAYESETQALAALTGQALPAIPASSRDASTLDLF